MSIVQQYDFPTFAGGDDRGGYSHIYRSDGSYEVIRKTTAGAINEATDSAFLIEQDPVDLGKHIVTFPHKIQTSSHLDLDLQVDTNMTDIGNSQIDIGNLQTDVDNLTPYTVYVQAHTTVTTALPSAATAFFTYINNIHINMCVPCAAMDWTLFNMTIYDSSDPEHVYAIGNTMFADIDILNKTIHLYTLHTSFVDVSGPEACLSYINTTNYLVFPHKSNTQSNFVFNKTTKVLTNVNTGLGNYTISKRQAYIKSGTNYYFCPASTATYSIYYFNDAAGTFHTINIGAMTTRRYNNHLLASNGKIYYTPFGVCYHILVLDTSDNSFTEIPIGLSVPSGWQNAPFVEGDNGCIYLAPYTDTNIIKIVLATNVLSTIATGIGIANAYGNGILATNNKIYWAPYSERNILILTCLTDAITLVDTADVAASKWIYPFQNNNTIYFTPSIGSANSILRINITSHAFSEQPLSFVYFDTTVPPQIINEKMFFFTKEWNYNVAALIDISGDGLSTSEIVSGVDSWCFSNTDTFYAMTDTLSYYKVL